MCFFLTNLIFAAAPLTNNGVPMGEKCKAYLAATKDDPGRYVDSKGVVRYRKNLIDKRDPRAFQPDPTFEGQDGNQLLKQLSDEKSAKAHATKLRLAAEKASKKTQLEEEEVRAHAERRPVSAVAQSFNPATASNAKIELPDTAKENLAKLSAQRQKKLEKHFDAHYGKSDLEGTARVKAARSTSANASTFTSVVNVSGRYEIQTTIVHDTPSAAEHRMLAMELLNEQIHTIDGGATLLHLIKGTRDSTDASLINLPQDPALFTPKDGTLPLTTAIEEKFAGKPERLDAFLAERAQRAAQSINAAKEVLASRGLLDATYPNGLSFKIDDSSFMFDLNGNAYLVHPHVVSGPN